MATTLYLHNDAADIGGNFWDALSTTPASPAGNGTLRSTTTTAAGTAIQLTQTAGGTVMEWITGYAAGSFTLSGTINVSMVARESASSVNAKLRVKVWKRDLAGTETAAATLDDNVEMGTTDSTLTWSGSPTSTGMAVNDRLVFRFYVIPNGTMGAGSVSSRTSGTNGLNFVQINETVTFTATENTSISGEASLTEGADSVAATGKLALSGAAAITEGADSVAAAATLAIKGEAGITEGADSLAATGRLAITGDASMTEGADSVSGIIANVILGAADIAEGDDQVAATGVLAIDGAASITEGADSVAAAGMLPIVGAADIIEGDDVLSATASVLIQGAADIGEAADALSATGILLISGIADLVEGADSVEASDFVPRGRADLIEDDDHIRAAGEIPASWMQEQATRGDIPNWNHCARCYKEVRPNELIRQTRRTGSSITWTGIYVCNDCLDPIHPQDRWPRKMAGDPKPVPNARPWKGS